MALSINTDFDYLRSRLRIPDVRMYQYQDEEYSIQEILEAEAAAGNQAAVQFAADMFTDVDQLIELFQLADPQNKIIIMKEMNPSQLSKLVVQLDVEDLVEGLQFFSQDSLLDLLKDVPKEELVKTVLDMFSEADIIQFMPENELDKFLTSVDMDKDFVLNKLQSIPETYLQQILESVTGEAAEGTAFDLVTQIGQLGHSAYKQAITNLEPEQKRQLTLLLTSSDKKLYEQFSTDSYLHIINRERNKNDLVKSMGVIKPEHLQGMVNQLPPELLQVVITQIDTQKFAHSLINQFPELLAQFISS
ncbi:MAG: hypothetical protein NC191_03360 [Muribaculaceae bacterium]|nr:hypothetical protein [Muribaculaceae bacterium]